jgi:phage terminase large subunit GpA-like protein
VGANSAAGLASRPIRDLIQDEVERYPLSAGSEGDPSSIAESRTATFPNRKNIKVSSPTTEQGPIWKEWLQSDQRWRWWPCPHCGHEQKMAFGGKDTTFGLKWDEGRPDSAHYVCAACACIIGDADKLWMDTRGRWIAENPESNIPGFRLSAIYSQFYSWADLVERWMKDHREPLKLRTFLNTMLCETWNDDGEQVTEHVLQAHKSTFPRGPDPEEDPQMIVPHGVGVLTRSVDMQGDRLEMAVWGWGEEEEAWRVDFKILEGDPSTREPWIKLLAELKRTYVHESGAKVQVARTFLDSGGGNTQQAYNFARKHRALRIFATKGSSKQAGVEFCIGPKRNRSARILMYELGSYTLKVALMKRLLKITEPGPGYIHLPHDIEEDELDQFLNEKLTPRMVGSREVKAWIQIGPNEQIDLFAYALAALNSLGTATMGALGKAATDLSNWKPPIVKQAEASPLDALRRSPARKNYATDWKRGR